MEVCPGLLSCRLPMKTVLGTIGKSWQIPFRTALNPRVRLDTRPQNKAEDLPPRRNDAEANTREAGETERTLGIELIAWPGLEIGPSRRVPGSPLPSAWARLVYSTFPEPTRLGPPTRSLMTCRHHESESHRTQG